jgi:hypothetical protein
MADITDLYGDYSGLANDVKNTGAALNAGGIILDALKKKAGETFTSTLKDTFAQSANPYGYALRSADASLPTTTAKAGRAATGASVIGNENRGAPSPTPLTYEEELALRESGIQAIMDAYSTTSGGPNKAILDAINSGIQNKNQQYKTNKADVENMYGQLTTQSEAATKKLMDAYQGAIQNTGQQAQGLQGILSGEVANQESRRAGAAKELGLGAENLQTNYRSTDVLNQGMADLLSGGQSFTNMLQSQQLSAKQMADSMVTAIKTTKGNTKLALTEAYQNAIGNYKAQKAAELAKPVTKNLTPVGEALMKNRLAELSTFVNGGGDVKEYQQKEMDKFGQLRDQLDINIKDFDYANPALTQLNEDLVKLYQVGSSSFDPTRLSYLLRYAQIMGYSKSSLPAI